MNKLNITIAEPCHEDWNNMQALTSGRHCEVCEKTVKDFTQQTREQIETYLLQHANEKICGRFRSGDVQTAAIVAPPVKVSWFRSRWMAFVAAVSFLGLSKKAGAYVPPVVDDQPDAENEKITPKSGQTIIHGWIRNSHDKKGMANVEVRIYSGGKEVAYSTSFANGSYFITIPEYTVWDYKVTLEYNAMDFQAQVLKDIPVIKDRVKLDIAMMAIKDLVSDFGMMYVQSYTMGGIGAEYAHVVPEKEYLVKEERLMGAVSIVRDISVQSLVVDSIAEVADEKPLVEEKAFDIKTYPNPSTGIFNLAMENTDGVNMMVYDLSGKMVLNKKVFSLLETIDLTDQPNGTYIVLAIDELTGIKKQSKVIKMQ